MVMLLVSTANTFFLFSLTVNINFEEYNRLDLGIDATWDIKLGCDMVRNNVVHLTKNTVHVSNRILLIQEKF